MHTWLSNNRDINYCSFTCLEHFQQLSVGELSLQRAFVLYYADSAQDSWRENLEGDHIRYATDTA